MDELTATLNARDIENTTTKKETMMETTTTRTGMLPGLHVENEAIRQEMAGCGSPVDDILPTPEDVRSVHQALDALNTTIPTAANLTIEAQYAALRGEWEKACVQIIHLTQQNQEMERKMANAAKNYAKLADRCRAAEARLKQQPQGMVAAPAPLSSQARRDAYQAHLATVLPIGQPCSKAHCPTCNQTQSTNNKGRCIPCSNAAVKAFYAKR